MRYHFIPISLCLCVFSIRAGIVCIQLCFSLGYGGFYLIATLSRQQIYSKSSIKLTKAITLVMGVI